MENPLHNPKLRKIAKPLAPEAVGHTGLNPTTGLQNEALSRRLRDYGLICLLCFCIYWIQVESSLGSGWFSSPVWLAGSVCALAFYFYGAAVLIFAFIGMFLGALTTGIGIMDSLPGPIANLWEGFILGWATRRFIPASSPSQLLGARRFTPIVLLAIGYLFIAPVANLALVKTLLPLLFSESFPGGISREILWEWYLSGAIAPLILLPSILGIFKYSPVSPSSGWQPRVMALFPLFLLVGLAPTLGSPFPNWAFPLPLIAVLLSLFLQNPRLSLCLTATLFLLSSLLLQWNISDSPSIEDFRQSMDDIRLFLLINYLPALALCFASYPPLKIHQFHQSWGLRKRQILFEGELLQDGTLAISEILPRNREVQKFIGNTFPPSLLFMLSPRDRADIKNRLIHKKETSLGTWVHLKNQNSDEIPFRLEVEISPNHDNYFHGRFSEGDISNQEWHLWVTRQNRIADLMDFSQQVVWELDKNVNTKSISTNITKITGFSPGELMHLQPQQWIPGDQVSRIQKTLVEKMDRASTEPLFVEFQAYRRDQSPVWLKAVLILIEVDEKTKHFLAILTDVTDQVLAEREILKLYEELESRMEDMRQVNENLKRFSHVVSHDLKAPLRYADFFAGKCIKMTQKPDGYHREGLVQNLEKIRTTVAGMNQLIEALLDFSENSRKQPVLKPTDLNPLIEEQYRQINVGVVRESLEWSAEEIPVVMADASLMEVVFSNLLGNAVKYASFREKIIISIKQEIQAASNMAIISIEDNGMGFSMTESQKMFEVFHRLKGSQQLPGTGIGLATVKAIVERHGGSIWAEGQPGKGAKFSLSLPLADSSLKIENMKRDGKPDRI